MLGPDAVRVNISLTYIIADIHPAGCQLSRTNKIDLSLGADERSSHSADKPLAIANWEPLDRSFLDVVLLQQEDRLPSQVL